MADESVKIEVDPGSEFGKTLKSIGEKIADLRVPLGLIAKNWAQSNMAMFSMAGPGKWEPLTDKYLKHKNRLGLSYNILELTGKLKASLTDGSDTNAVNEIINNNELLVGTKAATSKGFPYPIAIQKGFKTRKGRGNFMSSLAAKFEVKPRPFVMIGAEQTGPDVFNNREQAWVNIMTEYARQILKSGAV